MRLTLRTLLAYMDGMLEPADAEALKAKIEESDFAKILISRIEATIRQPRLACLPPEEKGLGLDANSIAEYLDNTLSADLVPQLEQFLLQSDMQLAEVAACHQVLASVLESEPFVSAELRHRVRCLGSPKELTQPNSAKRSEFLRDLDSTSAPSALNSPHPAPLSPASQSSPSIWTAPRWEPPSTTANASSAKQPTGHAALSMSDSMVMSDPLRPASSEWTVAEERGNSNAKSKRSFHIAITLALLAFLALATIQAIGPVSRLQMLWKAGTITGDSAAPASAQTNDLIVAQAPSPAASTAELPPTTTPANSQPNEPVAADSGPDGPSMTLGKNSNKMPLSSSADEDNALEASPENKAETSDETSANMAVNSSLTQPANKPTLPLVNVPVASWIPPTDLPQNHLLFALDETNHQLYRITIPTSFAHGTRLLIGPATRSSIQVNHDVRWDFYNAADVRVTADLQMPGITKLELRQGKAILQDSGKSNFIERQPETLLLNGNTLLRIRWREPNSAVAVEADPTWIDPSQYDPNYVGPLQPTTQLRISILQGKVEFSSIEIDQTSDKMELLRSEAGLNRLELGDVITRRSNNTWEAGKIESPPTWITSPAERPIDRQAAGDLMQMLPAGARANLVTVEALSNRRAEVAALAAQLLILADDFSFLAGPTGMLNDERFRSHWVVLIDKVRERIAVSQESFEALKASLAAQDVQRGALIFQVLVGYSGPEMKLNATERLVNLLESEYLDERILAIYHLKRMVGKDLGFQPDRPSRGVVQDWKRLWRGGGISPKEVK